MINYSTTRYKTGTDPGKTREGAHVRWHRQDDVGKGTAGHPSSLCLSCMCSHSHLHPPPCPHPCPCHHHTHKYSGTRYLILVGFQVQPGMDLSSLQLRY